MPRRAVRGQSSGNSGDRVDFFASTSLGRNRLATVQQSTDDNLDVVAWSLDGDQITQGGATTVSGDRIGDSGISLAAMGDGMVASVVRAESNRGRLAVWCVERGARSVTLLGHSGNSVNTIGQGEVIVPTPETAIMAAQTNSGRLKLIGFTIDS